MHGFLPVPGHHHRRYYRTSSSSFPGPYSVPSGVTFITLEKVSEAWKRSVFLFASQVSSMETMLSGVCTALGNLVLSRRDSLLADVRSTVPAEEVALLRYSPLPETVALFPSPLLDSALTKMDAAANDAVVQ